MPLRITNYLCGLVAFGLSMVLFMQSRLGLMPWDVLHHGISLISGWPLGLVAIGVGFVVLLAWIPIRQPLGIGTVGNVIIIGLVYDFANTLLGDAWADLDLPWRVVLLVSGIVLNGFATSAYLSARFGPGPRDGLMTGLSRRTGRSIRLVRTLIEGSVLLVGFLLGGAIGIGTLAYALAIGPLIQWGLGLFGRMMPAPTS